MLGIPAEDRRKIFDWTNQMTGAEDADLVRSDNDPEAAAAEVLMYSMGLAADRKANPRDDIVTKLVQADKGGRGLTDDEFGYFVIALAVAGKRDHSQCDHARDERLLRQPRPVGAVEARAAGDDG